MTPNFAVRFEPKSTISCRSKDNTMPIATRGEDVENIFLLLFSKIHQNSPSSVFLMVNKIGFYKL